MIRSLGGGGGGGGAPFRLRRPLHLLLVLSLLVPVVALLIALVGDRPPAPDETTAGAGGHIPSPAWWGGLSAFPSVPFLASLPTLSTSLHRRRRLADDTLDRARTKYPGEVLVMADEFDGSPLPVTGATSAAPETAGGLDLSFWQHEITMDEATVYTNNRSVSYARDGVLYIHPRPLSDILGSPQPPTFLDISGLDPPSLCTGPSNRGCVRSSTGGEIINPVVSARLRTAESFAFKYDRVEFRARLPRGDWSVTAGHAPPLPPPPHPAPPPSRRLRRLSPSLVLLPKHKSYGPWPASGEIDIMESRGNDPSYLPGGRDKFASTLHWGPSWDANAFAQTSRWFTPGGDLSTEFHTYGLVWVRGCAKGAAHIIARRPPSPSPHPDPLLCPRTV
jgi:hypothetical protein